MNTVITIKSLARRKYKHVCRYCMSGFSLTQTNSYKLHHLRYPNTIQLLRLPTVCCRRYYPGMYSGKSLPSSLLLPPSSARWSLEKERPGIAIRNSQSGFFCKQNSPIQGNSNIRSITTTRIGMGPNNWPDVRKHDASWDLVLPDAVSRMSTINKP